MNLTFPEVQLRVVTIEGFGSLAPESTESPGYIYEGGAWLLRFTTQSADHFFQLELANLCEVLGIDVRQIYKMVLYGRGYGLSEVRLSISFTKPPLKKQLDKLMDAVPIRFSHNHVCDMLDEHLRALLRSAKPGIKRRLAQIIRKERRNAVNEEIR
jgi:hypothetical protein